ncbi:hypothetical protein [Kitasatospora sp. NPDC057541]|uniref:hypothetical protein n=1 Tax=unclassified Kitasatospora TaxID=2633591 RepID=UPI00369857C8
MTHAIAPLSIEGRRRLVERCRTLVPYDGKGNPVRAERAVRDADRSRRADRN